MKRKETQLPLNNNAKPHTIQEVCALSFPLQAMVVLILFFQLKQQLIVLQHLSLFLFIWLIESERFQFDLVYLWLLKIALMHTSAFLHQDNFQ